MVRLTNNELREEYVLGLKGERFGTTIIGSIVIVGLSWAMLEITFGWWRLSLFVLPIMLIALIMKIIKMTENIKDNEIKEIEEN